MNNYKKILLFFLALAPLAWGLLVWLLNYGPAASLAIPYSLQFLIALMVLLYLCANTLEYAAHNFTVYFFDQALVLPRWIYLVGFAGLCVLLRLIAINILGYDVQSFVVINSLIMGVLASACIEELMARTLFIAYPINSRFAIFLNIVSSLAFSFMHMGFEESTLPFWDYLLVRGHFLFSFQLGLIAYKTKRIELCILLHMISNLFNYTLPVLIVGQAFQIPLSILSAALGLLILAGCYYKNNKTGQTIYY